RLPALAEPSVAACPEAVVGGAVAAVALLSLLPPPHAAMPGEMSGTATALAMKAMGLLRVIQAPSIEGRWSIARAGRSRHNPAPQTYLARTRLGRVGQALHGARPAPSGAVVRTREHLHLSR